MTKALVTGANGFIGSHVVQELLNQERSVRGFIQKNSDKRNLAGLQAEIFEGDLRDESSLKEALKGCDIVYHLGAYNQLWSPNDQLPYEINVLGTRHLIRHAKLEGVRKFIYTGSATLFRSNHQKLAKEEDFLVKPLKRNAYEYSKYLAEKEVLDAQNEDFSVVTLSPTSPVGEGDVNLTGPGRLILDFLKKKIPGYVDSGLNIIDVVVLARAFVRAEKMGKPGEQYILGGRNISFAELFEKLSQLTGFSPPKLKVPYWLAYVTALTSEKVSSWITHQPPLAPLEGVRITKHPCYYDCQKAKTQIGLEETDLEDCLKKSVHWFRGQGFCE